MKLNYFHKLGIFTSRTPFPNCVLQSSIPSRYLLNQEVTVAVHLGNPKYDIFLLEINNAH